MLHLYLVPDPHEIAPRSEMLELARRLERDALYVCEESDTAEGGVIYVPVEPREAAIVVACLRQCAGGTA
jgi:hypothetical protein